MKLNKCRSKRETKRMQVQNKLYKGKEIICKKKVINIKRG